MLTLLILAIVVAAWRQRSEDGKFAAGCIAFAAVFHEFYFSHLEGLPYHLSASLFALLVILAVSKLGRITRLSVSIQNACLVSIVANVIGWMLWREYFPPLAYDSAILLIYAWIFAILVKGSKGRGGVNTLDYRGFPVFFNYRKSRMANIKHKGTI